MKRHTSGPYERGKGGQIVLLEGSWVLSSMTLNDESLEKNKLM